MVYSVSLSPIVINWQLVQDFFHPQHHDLSRSVLSDLPSQLFQRKELSKAATPVLKQASASQRKPKSRYPFN
jgi:hypothetical protein